ncbi:hypothetical protein niasHS_003054 [Heterodera schachtii]|uniref:Uncharacterized protein n=1 Tax=Heterodera schachtii TaxID=97005 RepID=A0ABD2K9J7_HETSC
MSSVVGAVQQFVSSLNGQGWANQHRYRCSTKISQNFQISYMRPVMNAFASQQNPFITNVPSISSVAGVPNVNPLAQNSQNQLGQVVSSNPSTGGVADWWAAYSTHCHQQLEWAMGRNNDQK